MTRGGPRVNNLSRLRGNDVYYRSVNTQILQLWRKIETDPAKPRYICIERGYRRFNNSRD